MKKKNHNALISKRLKVYGAQSRAATTASVVAATAAWTSLEPTTAEALVSTFTRQGSSLINKLTTQISRGGAMGSFQFENGNSSLLMQYIFRAQGNVGGGGPGFVGPSVAMSATIGSGTGMLNPTGTFYFGSMGAMPTDTLIPLKIVGGGNNFFGWVRLPDPDFGFGTYTFGVSTLANTPVLAGTTTELAAVPEPGTALPLLLLGAAGVAARRAARGR